MQAAFCAQGLRLQASFACSFPLALFSLRTIFLHLSAGSRNLYSVKNPAPNRICRETERLIQAALVFFVQWTLHRFSARIRKVCSTPLALFFAANNFSAAYAGRFLCARFAFAGFFCMLISACTFFLTANNFSVAYADADNFSRT